MDFRIAATLAFVPFIAAACGGGGGGGGGSGPAGAPPPPPPVTVSADAGTDQQSAEETLVQLSGSGSSSDGSSVTYSWSQLRGPSVTLSNASLSNPTFTAPTVVVGYPQELEFRLTVNGPQSTSATDSIIVEVGPQESLFFRAADSGTALTTSLFRFDLYSSTQTRLSNNSVSGGAVKSFLVSPDGQYVAYLADEETVDQDELFLVPAGGGTVIKVNPMLATDGDVLDVSWSPDSTKLLFRAEVVADNVRDIYLHDVAANELTLVNSDQVIANGGYFGSPQWSPDGLSISYWEFDPTLSPTTGVRVHDVRQPAQPDIRVSDQPALALSPGIGDLHWTPDSSGGYFTAKPAIGQPSQLYSVARDGSNLADLAVPGATSVAVSPDGNYVATVADHDQDGEHSIFVVEADGTPSARVQTTTASGHTIGSMTWAPDGHRLAFRESVPTGVQRGLYTIRPDGSERVRITFDDTANGYITNFGWSPDSTAIAFRENPERSDSNEIFVAAADGSNVIRLSRYPLEPGRLTSMSDGTGIWSADSQRVTYSGEYDDDGLMGMYTARRDGGNRLLVSTKPVAFRGSARPEHSWSTNSEGVAFVSAQETNQTYDLFYTSENGAVTGRASIDMVPPGQVFGDFTWGPSP